MPRYSAAEREAVESRRVEKVYSVLARVYDEVFDAVLAPGRRHAVRRLQIRPGEQVLEVGVGTGLSIPLYPQHCRLTGIDISEPMLDRARLRAESLDRNGVQLYQMDARRLDFPDAAFDHVLAPYVMSVVPEPEKVMREMVRVCRAGGTVMVVNHFSSRNALLRAAERSLSPVSQWIGFRLDLPLERVTGTEGLQLTTVERVNLCWQLVEMQRRPYEN